VKPLMARLTISEQSWGKSRLPSAASLEEDHEIPPLIVEEPEGRNCDQAQRQMPGANRGTQQGRHPHACRSCQTLNALAPCAAEDDTRSEATNGLIKP